MKKLCNQMKRLKGNCHRFFVCDLGDVISIESCINMIVKECGPIDGLVYSAGIGDVRPLKMSKYDFMLRVMNINFFSFVEIIRCISKRGAYKEGLSIVGISSVAAQYGVQSRTAYSASKGAMDSAMRTMAKELGSKGIRVNNIAPGTTRSSMIDMYDTYASISEENKLLASRQYLGECETIDVANAALFLLSEKSRKITGIILNVDGGKMSC